MKSFRSNKSYRSEEEDDHDSPGDESDHLDIRVEDRRSFKTHKITTRSAGPRKKRKKYSQLTKLKLPT